MAEFLTFVDGAAKLVRHSGRGAGNCCLLTQPINRISSHHPAHVFSSHKSTYEYNSRQ